VLDIETDSTIIAGENAEEGRRAEFLQVLAPVLQLAQMNAVGSEPSLLARSTSSRWRRSASGARLTARSTRWSNRPSSRAQAGTRRPDHGDEQGGVADRQLKQKTQQEKNQAELQLKAQEMQMTDKRERDKIASNEKIKAAELMAKRSDDAAKVQQTNQKVMHDREKQMDLIGKRRTPRPTRVRCR
jgi:hypothetical protein